MTRTGRLQYTDRAFAQDIDLAMGSDIVLALIELVTNADDAYGTATGEIHVTVDMSQDYPLVRVADTARGLTPEELLSSFGELGGKVSGFHAGAEVRGLFGRGAKDTAAFGRTVFESIRNGSYGRFEIRRDASWELDESEALPSHYETLGIPPSGAGLTATIHVERSGSRIPSHTALAERLRDHVQLRDLNRRQVVILHRIAADTDHRSDVVRWNAPDGAAVHDAEIAIPGYGVPARLRLWRLSRASDTALSPYSVHGIAVRGRRATYENSLFGAQGAEANWIRGEIDCPHIDDLIREYDAENVNDANPSPLVNRDRSGLNSQHPFNRALASGVLDVLLPLLESMRPSRPSEGGGADLRGGLDRVAQALATLLRSDLQGLEEQRNGGVTPDSDNPLLLIPPRLRLRGGSYRSLSVVMDHAVLGTDSTLEVISTDPSVVRVESVGEGSAYAEHESATIRNIRLFAVRVGSANIIARHSSGRSTACETSVHDDPPVETDAPADLEWGAGAFNITKGRPRTLLLRAPLELAPEGRLECSVRVEDGENVVLEEASILLKLVKEGWLEGRVKARGHAIGSCKLIARSAASSAEAAARVTEPKGLGGLGTRVAIVDEQQGRLRGRLTLEDDGYLVTVFKRHTGLDQLLGKAMPDGAFERENLPDARIGLTEAVATVVADWLVTKETERFPHMYTDASAVLDLRNRQIQRYLPAIRTALVRSDG